MFFPLLHVVQSEMPEGASTEHLESDGACRHPAHRLRKRRSGQRELWPGAQQRQLSALTHTQYMSSRMCAIRAWPEPGPFLLPKCKRNRWNMKSLQHHVKKLAELMRKADALMDRKKAAKLIKKAEERAAKIRKRCQSLEDRQSESDSQNG